MSSSAPPSPTATSVVGPSTEVQYVNDLLVNMREALGNLGQNYETLDKHATRVAALAPELEIQDQLKNLRLYMKAQDQRYNAQMQEVQQLLEEVLREQLMDHLRNTVERMVDDVFEEEVERQVKLTVEEVLPIALQEQLVEHQAQLQEVQRSLHNSEARRANSMVRYGNMQEPLKALLTPAGVPSAHFPKNLGELFAIDRRVAKELAAEYKLPESTESRERNLNTFMAFIGVMYQMVPATS